MLKKRIHQSVFVNPYFDRFLMQAMSAPLSRRAMALLNESDMLALREKERFIAMRGLEDKLLLLSRLGYPFALVVGAPQKSPNTVQIARYVSVFFKALSFKRQDALRVMREKFFFVLSDVDFLKGLNLSSNIFNSPASSTLPGYSHVADQIYKYKFEEQKKVVRDHSAGHTIDDIVVKAVMLASISDSAASFQALFGIDIRGYVILALVSRYRELSLNDLTIHTKGLRNLSETLRSLVAAGHLETKHVVVAGSKTSSKPRYWITGQGEQTLGKARFYFVSIFGKNI